MTFPSMISLVFSVLAFQGANAAVTLIQPVPTVFPSVSSFSIPSFSLPPGVSLSIPTGNPIPSASSASLTAIATVSVGGVESSDGATTYFLQDIGPSSKVPPYGTKTTYTKPVHWMVKVAHSAYSKKANSRPHLRVAPFPSSPSVPLLQALAVVVGLALQTALVEEAMVVVLRVEVQ
ncbi:hypothetical protein B0H10DRAFT_2219563 [Mycena sp. CBHHK59/15]|nr:hypothetical protein B0H10DRAFT_2219563 [Mycena sp. CBHHK59/15]